MTLAQYLARYSDVAIVQPYGPDGAIQLFLGVRATLDPRWDVFHLSDYVVSSAVSGSSYILMER